MGKGAYFLDFSVVDPVGDQRGHGFFPPTLLRTTFFASLANFIYYFCNILLIFIVQVLTFLDSRGCSQLFLITASVSCQMKTNAVVSFTGFKL